MVEEFVNLGIKDLLRRLAQLGDLVPMELVQTILSKGPEALPALVQVLENERFWQADDERWWMPVHAVKLLGTLGDPSAIPAMVKALVLADEADNDWVLEDLPVAFARIGPQAVDPLMEFIGGHRGDLELTFPRAAAASSLAAIALHHPQERDRILAFLHSLFREGEDPEFLEFVAIDLLNLGDPASLPVVERAFTTGLFTERVMGRDVLERVKAGIWKRDLGSFQGDLLAFYSPEQVEERRESYESERREEEEERAARWREESRRAITQELRRLEAVMQLLERGFNAPIGRVGRNDACPCGSGKKFKKCCLPFVDTLPPKNVYGRGRYVSAEYLSSAWQGDPMLVLENLTALAVEAAAAEDLDWALNTFTKLEPLAEKCGALGNLLDAWVGVCLDHPEPGGKGLAIIRRLQAFYEGKDQKSWADAKMDEADYLGEMGRWEEGRKEYEELLASIPENPFIPLRFASFLQRWGKIEEAARQYENVLRQEGLDPELLEMAAEELDEMADFYDLELDPQTRELIERLIANP